MNKRDVLLTIHIVKEIIRIIFILVFLNVGFIGAWMTKEIFYIILILVGVSLIGIGKNPLDMIKDIT